jgi:hypothetical protein
MGGGVSKHHCGVSRRSSVLPLRSPDSEHSLTEALSAEHRASRMLSLKGGCIEHATSSHLPSLNSWILEPLRAPNDVGSGTYIAPYWGKTSADIWSAYFAQRVSQQKNDKAGERSTSRSGSRSQAVRVDTALGPEYHVVKSLRDQGSVRRSVSQWTAWWTAGASALTAEWRGELQIVASTSASFLDCTDEVGIFLRSRKERSHSSASTTSRPSLESMHPCRDVSGSGWA